MKRTPLKDYPGYAISTDPAKDNDITVWSEWKFHGQGQGRPPKYTRSGEWKPLATNKDGKVKLRSPDGSGMVTRSVKKLLVNNV